MHISFICNKCHNSKFVIFQERILKVLKFYNFLWVQRRHSCSPAASFANCVMTLYMLKLHLQIFISIPITQICQILSCDTLVANQRYIYIYMCVCVCVCVCTGCFIMFSVITNIYNKKTKGPILMELFKATGKLNKFFWQLEMFDVCTTGDTAHIDTIFKFLPHTRQDGCIDILHCCNDPCF